jgi:hypothetical protein
MNEQAKEQGTTGGPTGDVDYDEDALRDAEDKMHAPRHGTAAPGSDDPDGGHDPGALEDAKRKMTNRT